MEITAPTDTRRLMAMRLTEKAWKDPEFRTQVVKDPKGALEKHLGQKLPEKLKIFIHEEDKNTVHFSIPPTPAAVAELSDEDLEKVAGGTEFFIVVSVVAAVTAVGTAVGGA